MVKKTVYKHQTIDLVYMRSHPVMTQLVDRFEQIGLANFLQHRCHWNETVIRQFYVTLEISIEEKKYGGQLEREPTMHPLLNLLLQTS